MSHFIKRVSTESARFIDSHCHLDFECFARDLGEQMGRWRSMGVTGFVVPGVAKSRWCRVLEFCRENRGCYPALGIHPCFLAEYESVHLQVLEELLAAEIGVRAVGEIGLDKTEQNWPLQEEVFIQQLAIAGAHHLPVIVHARKAFNEVIYWLKRMKFEGGGVIHGFSGSYEQAMTAVNMNFKIGVGGVITYERAKKSRAAVAQIPLSAIVLETDAPDMPVCGLQGKRNTPASLIAIANVLCSLRSEERPVILDQIYSNTVQLFGLPLAAE